MFTLRRSIRNCFLVVALATLAGCAEDGPPLGPDAEPSFTVSSGRGGGAGSAPRVEEFDGDFDDKAWIASDQKRLGHGFFQRANVSQEGGKLLLTLRGLDGAEIRSASRVAHRDVEIIMQTPRTPDAGTISAFFLYQLVPTRNDRNDEIDFEILNDGSRTILFSTYIDAVQTNHVEATLPFDPSRRPHSYKIEWSADRVRFLVDGKPYLMRGRRRTPLPEFTTGIPQNGMYVMANTWWPKWVLFDPNPTGLDVAQTLEIESITY